MDRIEVVEKEDDFNIRKWTFWLSGVTLYLDEFVVMSRETKRHKFQVDVGYTRTGYRRPPSLLDMKIENVALPDWVATEAIKTLANKIKVSKTYR